MGLSEYFLYLHLPFAIIYAIGAYTYYIYKEDEVDYFSDFKEKVFISALVAIFAGPLLFLIWGIIIFLLLLDKWFRRIIYLIKHKKLDKLIGRSILTHHGSITYVIVKAETFNKWQVLGKHGKLLPYTSREARLLDERNTE